MTSAYRLILTENHVRTRDQLTLGPSAGDRNLGLLVLNQGHGGLGWFGEWDAQALALDLVAPMVASGISADVIMLDFCSSASLLPVMAPLCAPGGIIVSSLYSVSETIVTSAFWDEIKPALDAGNSGPVRSRLLACLKIVSAGITGLAHLDRVRAWDESRTQRHIAEKPGDRDPLSIVRYLPDIASALSGPATPSRIFGLLQAVKMKPCLGFAEKAILANLPASASAFTADMLATIQNQFRDRLTDILTLDRYGLKIDVAGRSTFGGDQSLWGQIIESRFRILALAAGLDRCPTPYSVWYQSRGSLRLDAALAQPPISASASRLISRIESHAPEDVDQIIGQLNQTQLFSVQERVNNYLQ